MNLLGTLFLLVAIAPLAAVSTGQKIDKKTEARVLRDLDYKAALDAAKRENKLLLIAFVQEGEPESRKLDATWRDPKVSEWIEAKAVAIAVDLTKQRDLAARFRIYSAPALVFVSPEGLELDRARGFRDAKSFLEDASSATSGKDAVTRTKDKLAGHEQDPWLRLDHASALHDQGQLREALGQYLWCWDHGIESDPNFAPARNGAVLEGLDRLAKVYPDTLEEILERIEVLGQRLANDAASEADVADLIELGTRFDREDLLIQLHDLLAEKGEATAAVRKKLAPFLFETWIEEKRYDEALACLGDPEKELERRIAQVQPELAAAASPAGGPMPRHSVTRFALDCFEAAVATRQNDLAQRVAERALAFDARVGTWIELVRRARRAGATNIAIELVRRGLDGKLTAEEKQALRDSTVAFPRLK